MLYKSLLTVYIRIYGERNCNTLAIMTFLAFTYRKVGRSDDALALQVRINNLSV